MNDNFKIFGSKSEGFAAAARFFCDCVAEAVKKHGFFTAALSGGRTPDGLFALLASEYRNRIEWNKGHLFWVDERCVPPDSEFSNYGLAARLLLANVPVLPQNVHRIEAVKDFAAEDYDLLLRNYAMMRRTATGIPVFDVILMGLGLNGHTASLFPEADSLREDKKFAIKVPVAASALPAVPRITLTLPVLNSAANLFFLISGNEKLKLAEYISDSRSPLKYPAQLIKPAAKPAIWFVCGL
ncbi:MAG: 6-phosphogluconolactonase [Victivallaceae bacterium]